MKQLHALFTLIVVLMTGNSYAADTAIYSDSALGAIKGADVVAYYSLTPKAKAVLGDKSISHRYMGATWHFSTEENRALFAAKPEQYAPEFGGYCAFAVSHGFTKPIDPNRWHIVDGKLYLNYNRIADYKWKKDQDAAIVRGHNNWPTVLSACEQHESCNQ